jgi:hypothetical protein
MAVWVVVVVLGVGAAAAAYAARRQTDDVEPSVRQFTEFRDAISRQVEGVHNDTHTTRRHLDRQPVGPSPPAVPPRSHEQSSPTAPGGEGRGR